MSTFQPEGVSIEFNGEERHLIWDFGVIEKIQDKYGGHPIIAIQKIFWEQDDLRFYLAKPLLDILEVLLNNEVAREKYFNGSSTLKTYKREELGMLVDRMNANKIAPAIVESWIASNPETDSEEDEDDPKNVKSGQRNRKK